MSRTKVYLVNYDLTRANLDFQKGKRHLNLLAGVKRYERTTATLLRISSASSQLRFESFALNLGFFNAFSFMLSCVLNCFPSSLLHQGSGEREMCGKAGEKVQESEGNNQ